MIVLQMNDLRKFTSHLFMKETFDGFWLSEATVQTAASLVIEGRVDPEFYAEMPEEAKPEKIAPYITWGDVRKQCFEWIKGSVLPLNFRVLLRDPSRDYDEAFINIRYEREKPLRITTGYAAKEFTLDRSDEKEWDDEVRRFFVENELDFEEL